MQDINENQKKKSKKDKKNNKANKEEIVPFPAQYKFYLFRARKVVSL